MTPSEFKLGLEELRRFFGENNYNPSMSSVLWDILRPLSYAEFNRVIDLLVQEHPRAPSVASIKKAALPMLRDAETIMQRDKIAALEEIGQRCKRCDHSGFVIALLKSNPAAEFSFRCPACSAAKARKIDQRIPEWSDELKEKYIPTSFRTEDHFATRKLQTDFLLAKIQERMSRNIVDMSKWGDE